MRSMALLLGGLLVSGSAWAVDTGTAGGGQPIDTMQPSLGLKWAISRTGTVMGPESGNVDAGGAVMLGEIRLLATTNVPANYSLCDGQLMPIQQNTDLFSLLGTTYGGDGVSTFRLPDLRGRAAAGFGSGQGLTDRPLGQPFGTERVTQTVATMPSHQHTTLSLPTGSSGGGQPLATSQPTLAIHPVL